MSDLQTLLEGMLAPDGYSASVQERGGRLRIEISASPDACVDCLVPKDVLELVVRSEVPETGEIEIIYPSDSEVRS